MIRIHGVTAVTFLAAALAAGCASSPTDPVVPLTALPRALTVAERSVIAGSNSFAFDLMRAVNADEAGANVFISPLSVSMALGMTLNGAAGTTFDEMRETLDFGGLSQTEINASYRSLTDLLLGLDRTVDMRIANSVWYRQEFPVEQPFVQSVQASFGARVEGRDFANPATLNVINGWVSSATNNRIESIIDEIRPEHIMFLINAIYFKGAWTDAFDRSATRADTFRAPGGASVPVQMMNTDGSFRARMTNDYQAVELPYGNTAFTMTIVMPAEGVDIEDFADSLDGEAFDALVSGMGEGRIMLSMPRFRLEYEKTLNDALKALGMPTAFTDAADFSGISRGGGLSISEVKHKTFVEVNEEGTEAAAVTSVGIVLTSAPPSIRIDRPFVFVIRERFSGTILFAGKIVEPVAG